MYISKIAGIGTSHHNGIILGYYSSNPLAKLTRDNYNSWPLGHSSSNISIEIPCWYSYPKLRKPLPLFILKPLYD